MGRPTIHDTGPMTAAERMQRYRARKGKTINRRRRALRKQQKITGNKFHKGNGADGRHYWLTPPELYARLNVEFGFSFDPCPWPLPEGFDGLTCDWGRSNYVNPPFGSFVHNRRKKGPTAWARKALAEHAKGKTVVLVYPIDKWVLALLEAGAVVRNLGDVRWLRNRGRLTRSWHRETRGMLHPRIPQLQLNIKAC
jgi:hypothetical protein